MLEFILGLNFPLHKQFGWFSLLRALDGSWLANNTQKEKNKLKSFFSCSTLLFVRFSIVKGKHFSREREREREEIWGK